MTKLYASILLAFMLIQTENLNASILNNIEDACISELVNISISENETNEISMLIKNFYAVSDSINLTINQVNDLDNFVDAVTDGCFSPLGQLNIEISFNGNTMPAASREYIMATLYHEFLHAILLCNGVKDGQHHEPIAQGYRKILGNTLLQHFPDLSKADIFSLTWGGLQRTKAWNGLSESYRREIMNTNLAHKARKKGSGCN